MKILGIDPGLQVCGYACMKADAGRDTLLEAGVFKTDSALPIEAKLNQIAEDIDSLLQKFSPDVVAVEELYSHYAHPKTAILMGHAIDVKSFSATRIKKSLTGNGRASKEQVQRTIQKILLLPDLPEPSDVADAIAAAMCCANSMNNAAVLMNDKL